jgi:hypothetical protein
MATNYLTRSPGTPTSEKIATMSCWVKVNDIAGSIGLFAQTATAGGVMFFINASSELEFYATNSSSQAARVVTNRKLRDPLAWYLIQCHIDTTQGTSADRVKLYVNGSQETSLSTASYPTQNINLNGFDGSGNQIFGSLDNLSYNCKADVADAYFIDGSIIASNQFWETDATTGQIKPKLDPTIGSFGTNGYHLKFENANQGLDSKPSGASNFTTTGTIRQQVDTPSNVFCTLNPMQRSRMNTNNFGDYLKVGNNTFDTSSSNGMRAIVNGTIGAQSGKWYWEAKVITNTRMQIGISTGLEQKFPQPYYDETEYSAMTMNLNGQFTGRYTGSAIDEFATGTANTTNDILGFALDMDNKALYIHKNGTYLSNGSNTGVPTSGSSRTGSLIEGFAGSRDDYFPTGEFMFPVMMDISTSGVAKAEFNFGNGFFGTTAVASAGTNASGFGTFEYDVPTGYTALCTKGLNE